MQDHPGRQDHKGEHRKINELYNFDRFSPVDGSIIEFCDKFAAYMEAYLSIKHGITSKHLIDGHSDLYRDLPGKDSRDRCGSDF